MGIECSHSSFHISPISSMAPEEGQRIKLKLCESNNHDEDIVWLERQIVKIITKISKQ